MNHIRGIPHDMTPTKIIHTSLPAQPKPYTQILSDYANILCHWTATICDNVCHPFSHLSHIVQAPSLHPRPPPNCPTPPTLTPDSGLVHPCPLRSPLREPPTPIPLTATTASRQNNFVPKLC